MKALLKIMKSSCPHKNEETQNVITLDIIRCAKKIEEKKCCKFVYVSYLK